MNLSTIRRKAGNIIEDFTMLLGGEWEPDEDSIEASLSNAVAVEAAFPLIIEMAEMLSDIKEWLETGKVDGCSVDKGAILDDLNNLNVKMEQQK